MGTRGRGENGCYNKYNGKKVRIIHIIDSSRSSKEEKMCHRNFMPTKRGKTWIHQSKDAHEETLTRPHLPPHGLPLTGKKKKIKKKKPLRQRGQKDVSNRIGWSRWHLFRCEAILHTPQLALYEGYQKGCVIRGVDDGVHGGGHDGGGGVGGGGDDGGGGIENAVGGEVVANRSAAVRALMETRFRLDLGRLPMITKSAGGALQGWRRRQRRGRGWGQGSWSAVDEAAMKGRSTSAFVKRSSSAEGLRVRSERRMHSCQPRAARSSATSATVRSAPDEISSSRVDLVGGISSMEPKYSCTRTWTQERTRKPKRILGF